MDVNSTPIKLNFFLILTFFTKYKGKVYNIINNIFLLKKTYF
jgi:hypothetical protein